MCTVLKCLGHQQRSEIMRLSLHEFVVDWADLIAFQKDWRGIEDDD